MWWTAIFWELQLIDFELLEIDTCNFCQIIDAVVAARILNATLIVPKLDQRSYWKDARFLFLFLLMTYLLWINFWHIYFTLPKRMLCWCAVYGHVLAVILRTSLTLIGSCPSYQMMWISWKNSQMDQKSQPCVFQESAMKDVMKSEFYLWYWKGM